MVKIMTVSTSRIWSSSLRSDASPQAISRTFLQTYLFLIRQWATLQNNLLPINSCWNFPRMVERSSSLDSCARRCRLSQDIMLTLRDLPLEESMVNETMANHSFKMALTVLWSGWFYSFAHERHGCHCLAKACLWEMEVWLGLENMSAWEKDDGKHEKTDSQNVVVVIDSDAEDETVAVPQL